MAHRLKSRRATKAEKARSRPAKLSGWSKLPGSAERYIDPSGKVRSRRQYENERSKKAGWSSWSEYQRTRKSKDFNRRLKQALDNEQDITKSDIGVEGVFARAYNDVTKARAENDMRQLRDPNGALADFLVLLGHRDAEDFWDVGDTPSGQ